MVFENQYSENISGVSNDKANGETNFFSNEASEEVTRANVDAEDKEKYNKIAYECVAIGEYFYLKPKPLKQAKRTKEVQLTLLVEMTEEEIENEERLKKAKQTNSTQEELNEAMNIFKDFE